MRGRTKRLLCLGLSTIMICSSASTAIAGVTDGYPVEEQNLENPAADPESGYIEVDEAESENPGSEEEITTVEETGGTENEEETQTVIQEEVTGADESGNAQQPEGAVLHYDFGKLDGTIINDQSGNGQAGVVRPTGSQVETEKVDIYGQEYTAFIMKGGQPDETHTYVELPSGVLNGLEDATISCWVYVNANQGYQRIWDFGSDTTSYMYLLTDGGNEGHTGYTAGLTNKGWSEEKGPESPTLETGKWVLTTVTYDGSEKKMSLYKDGELLGTETTEADLRALEGSNQNWIGYGQFKNDIFNGKIADFKIYNYAMTDAEVADTFNIPDEERVAIDKANLTLGDTSALTENLNLPVKGSAGSDITWETTNDSVITTEGVITRPQSGQPDGTATLTAHISSGEVSDAKTFEITVLSELSDEQKVKNDLAAIKIENTGSVKEDLVLPVTGAYGSEITWESSDESVVATDGKVVRPVGKNKDVTLTATAEAGDYSESREFTVTVVQRYAKKSVKKVEDVAVTTAKGILPTLPSKVKVTYSDGEFERLKVTWPTDLKKGDYLTEGTVEVFGTLTEYKDIKVKATVTITADAGVVPAAPSASGFELSDVTLDGSSSIYAQNNSRALEYLKVMDADRMLYNVRMTFGEDTKGAQPLTGWEEPTGLLRGHSTGHFLSGLALAYASTGDSDYKSKLDYMIEEMRKLQEKSKGRPEEFQTKCTPSSASQKLWSTNPEEWGEGFISAYSPDQFALLEQYTPYATIWAPYYTLHKLLAGFIDSYTYTGNEEALEIAKDLGTWVYKRLSLCTTPEQRTKMWGMYIAGEFGGMNESLARLYEITKDTNYRDAAQMFDNTTFFDNLADNVDDIQRRHANQHIPQIVGAIHEYAATGDGKYYNIAKNFWDMTTSRYAYSIGGVGTGETFKDPYRQGNNILGNTGRGENCETCAAYNMLKLTMDLSLYDPDNAEYMDYYERTLVNQIAASQSHDTTEYMHNGVTYMLPIDPGQKRDYDSDYGGFTCCNGTGMENHVKYQQAAYTKSGDALYVNLYMPSTVNWEEKGVKISQETNFPSEHSRLTLDGSGTFTMKLRVPYWATKGFTVKVNNETICTNPEVSSFVEINRTWNSGDEVTIDMPYTLYLDETPDKVDDSTVASVMYGPLVMVAKDTRESYTPMNWYTVSLGADLDDSIEILQKAGDGEVPHLKTNGLDFFPMYDAYNYRYHAYVKVEDKADPIPDPNPNPDPNPDPNPNPTPTPDPTPAPDDNKIVVTPGVEDKGNGKVEVTIPDVSTGNPDEKKDVTVELPKEDLENAIKNSKDKDISVNVTVPDSITDSENVNLEELILPKEVLQAAKDEDKDITVDVTDSKGNTYSWCFSGKDVDESRLADVNLKLETRKALEDDQINDKLHADEFGIVIDFAHEGGLPAEASVTVDAQALGFKPGDKATLYCYNEETGKLESQGKAYTVDKDGGITIEISHCSKYILKKTTAIKVNKVTGVKTTVSNSAAKLSWKKQSGVTGYKVYRYNTSKKKYVEIADVKGTSYTDKGLKSAAAYRYAVRAYTKASKTYYSSYTGNLKVLTKPAAPASVKAKRTSKVSTKTTADISFKKVDRASTYRIYKYDKKTKKYTIAYRVVKNKLYQYNGKTKKYKNINNVKVKKGVITCSLKNLNLKSEKTQKYMVRATVSKSGYTTQYSVNSKAVTIK